MGFKMNGWSGYQSSPLTKKIWPPGEPDVDKEIEKGAPGHGNPNTPDYLYKADGTKVSIANIDEQLLKGNKTDSKGRYTLYKDEMGRETKYYYENPGKKDAPTKHIRSAGKQFKENAHLKQYGDKHTNADHPDYWKKIKESKKGDAAKESKEADEKANEKK